MPCLAAEPMFVCVGGEVERLFDVFQTCLQTSSTELTVFSEQMSQRGISHIRESFVSFMFGFMSL